MQKMDELILRELANELRSRYPDIFFSLSQVHVSKDLSFAKIWVSALSKSQELVDIFQKDAPELKRMLSKKVQARKVPSLYFVADLTEEKAEKIDKLLSEIRKGEKK